MKHVPHSWLTVLKPVFSQVIPAKQGLVGHQSPGTQVKFHLDTPLLLNTSLIVRVSALI